MSALSSLVVGNKWQVLSIGDDTAIVCHYNNPGKKTHHARIPKGAQFTYSCVRLNNSERFEDWNQLSNSLRITIVEDKANLSIRLLSWLKKNHHAEMYKAVVKTSLELVQ